MSDEKKTSRWAKSLDKAGILDPLTDGWELPVSKADEPLPTIVVDKRPTESPPPADEPDVIVSARVPRTEAPPEYAPIAEMPVEEMRKQLRQRFDMGDFSGALELAERLLGHDPRDQEASMFKLKAKNTLMQMFEAKIGSFKRIPRQVVSKDEMVWRSLDATSAFIASNVDGTMSFEDIVDISTVSRFDTCRILSQLLQEGIIE